MASYTTTRRTRRPVTINHDTGRVQPSLDGFFSDLITGAGSFLKDTAGTVLKTGIETKAQTEVMKQQTKAELEKIKQQQALEAAKSGGGAAASGPITIMPARASVHPAIIVAALIAAGVAIRYVMKKKR